MIRVFSSIKNRKSPVIGYQAELHATQALGRSYALDEDIDEAELDDELAALDEQLALESEVKCIPTPAPE
jgi:hypothetical protein